MQALIDGIWVGTVIIAGGINDRGSYIQCLG